jgi:acetyl-CoA synthetase
MLNPLPLGEVGHIALRLPDPVAFLGYWNNPQATARKMRGGYLFTGDLGWVDGDGFLWFESRADDLIKSSGYRLESYHLPLLFFLGEFLNFIPSFGHIV